MAAPQSASLPLPRPRLPLPQAVLDPGFTPRARDLDALVDLLADDALVKAAERAIGRLGEGALDGLRRFAEEVLPGIRDHPVHTPEP